MPKQCNTQALEFESGTRSRPEQDGSTFSVSRGQGRGVVWVSRLQRGGARRWRTILTIANLHYQRAKSSPLWSRLCPETRIGHGLARIPRVLCGNAKCGAGPASPPRTARRDTARDGEMVEGATLFLIAGAPLGRVKGDRENPTPTFRFSGSLPPL